MNRVVKFFQNLVTPKASAAAPLTSQTGLGLLFRLLLPGTDRDYEGELAGKVHLNTLVALAMDYFASNFAESPLIVQQQSVDQDGKRVFEHVPDHPLELLSQEPNEFYTWDVLAYGIAASWALGGNTYLLVWPDRLGRPSAIYWLQHDRVTPMDDGDDQDGSKIVTHYRYDQPGGGSVDIPPKFIVHLRRGIDPNDVRKGFAPLKAALREVFGDNVASTYSSAILDNLGIPPAVLSFPDRQIEKDQQETIADSIRQKFRGDGNGQVAVMPVGAKIDILAFKPKDLAIKELNDQQVGRICAAMGFDPMTLGLPSANKTYSNKAEADDAAYTCVILPAKRSIAGQATVQLLRRWYREKGTRVWWDFSEVAAMQDDMTELFDRAGKAFTEGWITRGEARQIAKMPAGTDDDKYSYELTGGGQGANMDQAPPENKTFADQIRAKLAARRAAGE